MKVKVVFLLLPCVLSVTAVPSPLWKSHAGTLVAASRASLDRRFPVTSRSHLKELHIAASQAVTYEPSTKPNEQLERPLSTFHDTFLRSRLGPWYEVTPGWGAIDLQPGGLRYRILTQPGLQVQGEDGYLHFDSLGRPAVPSLMVSLGFLGDQWVLEAQVTYHFREVLSNSRSGHLWLAFGGLQERKNDCIKLTRFAELAKGSDALYAEVYEHAKLIASRHIDLNAQDKYLFRILRSGRRISTFVSNDGVNFILLLDHSFGEQIEGEPQRWIVNGSAFSNGAFFDINSLTLKGSAPQGVFRLIRPSEPRAHFEVSGLPNHPYPIEAKEIVHALREGKDVSLSFCRIKGNLDLTTLGPTTDNTLEFSSCIFEGKVFIVRPIAFRGRVSFTDCIFRDVGLSGAQFSELVKWFGCSFTGDTRFIESEFLGGADFTLSTFQHKAFFRASHFDGGTSFYYSSFREGADLSEAVYLGDLSFSDVDFSNGDITFFNSIFHGATYLVSSLQRDARLDGEELDFSDCTIMKIIVSSGQPEEYATAQTGRSRWDINSRLSFRGAKISGLRMTRLRLTQSADFSNVDFLGGPSSVWLIDVEFSDLKLAWPVGTITAPPRTRTAIVKYYRDKGDTVNERLIYFDSLSEEYTSTAKAKGHCLSCWISRKLLSLLWISSRYATNWIRLALTGLALIFIFAFGLSFVPERSFVEIEKPFEIKTRLSETPVLSYGEKPIALKAGGDAPKGGMVYSWIVRPARKYWLSLKFSATSFAKIGVGNIRIKQSSAPLVGLVLVWVEWVVGYLWYAFLLYTFAGTSPVLRGIFGS